MNNVLIISDTHMPFVRSDYLEFCVKTRNKFKCDIIVHIGDLVDNHAISYHEHDPDGWSPAAEMAKVDEHLQSWFKEFPKVHLVRGNHDILVDRKSKTIGLPNRCFKPFREIWNLPEGWVDAFEFEIDNVRYIHGTGYSGKYGHVQAAYNNRQSIVMGHSHSSCGIEYAANSKDIIYGMNVGCGIDRKKYAFNYGRDFKRKPIVACGVILDNGKYPIIVPMNL